MKRGGLRPSRISTVASKVTAYENYILKLVASKCGVSKSLIARIALLLLLTRILEESRIKEELIPGYENIMKQLSGEAKEELVKCINKLKETPAGSNPSSLR